MSEHTLGPWFTIKSKTSDGIGIASQNGTKRKDGKPCILAECFSEINVENECAYSQQKANANLIAAAPDLYRALYDYCLAVECGLSDKARKACLFKAKVALAKARGNE